MQEDLPMNAAAFRGLDESPHQPIRRARCGLAGRRCWGYEDRAKDPPDPTGTSTRDQLEGFDGVRVL